MEGAQAAACPRLAVGVWAAKLRAALAAGEAIFPE